MSVWTIVVAGGSGARFGGLKQFEPLGHGRVVDWSIATATTLSDGVVVVVPPGTTSDERGADPVVTEVAGGASRSASVRNGLAAVPASAEVILIHDGARPFASVDLFRRVVAGVRAGADGVIPGVPVTDTVKRVAPDGTIVATIDRSDLRAVQTPQGFRGQSLREAYSAAAEATDDAAVVEAWGGRVIVIDGEADNRKITTRDDLVWAREHIGKVAI